MSARLDRFGLHDDGEEEKGFKEDEIERDMKGGGKIDGHGEWGKSATRWR